MNGFLVAIVLLISSPTFAQEGQIAPQASPQNENTRQQVVSPTPIQNQVATSAPASTPIPVIVNGQAPVISPPINERPSQSVSKRFYFSFLVGYDTANEAKAPNSIAVAGADQIAGEYTFGTESAPLFGIEIGEKTEYAMGWALGYSGSLERKIKSVTFDSGSNSSPTTAAGTGQISLGSLYYDSIFYFKNSYIKFGLNYSFPGISGMANSNITDIQIDSSMGLQLGGGVLINDNIALDISYKRTDARLSSYSASGVAVDYNIVHFDGLQAALKLFF